MKWLLRMGLAVYLPAIQSRAPGKNRKKALVLQDRNTKWQLKTQGSSQVSLQDLSLGQGRRPLDRENQSWQWNLCLAYTLVWQQAGVILKEELLAAQGCIHNAYPGHAVGLCQGAWAVLAGSGRPGPGPAAAIETVIHFLT